MSRDREVLLQSVVPPYRRDLFALLTQARPNLTIITPTHEQHLGSGRRTLIVQRGVYWTSVRARRTICEFNPRLTITWLIVLSRRITLRETILWGHFYGRALRSSRSSRLARWLLLRLAGTFLAYSTAEADIAAAALPHVRCVAAPNALYSRAHVTTADPPREDSDVVDIVCSGRLIATKTPENVLEAFAQALTDLPTQSRLVFIGDGPLAAHIAGRAEELDIAARVRVLGETYDYSEVEAVYARALVAVGAGYVGLAITQAHWFGVPFLYADIAKHAPEVTAAASANAVQLPADSPAAFAEGLRTVFRDADEWRARRALIANATHATYAVENAVDGFEQALGRSTG